MGVSSVGLVAKPGSGLAEEAAARVVGALQARGVEVVVERDTAMSYARFRGFPVFDISSNPPEYLVVVGGDGTLLRSIQRLPDPSRVTVMAVRAGKRGFLLDVEPYEIDERVGDFVEGRYRVVEYPRLATRLAGKTLPCALNDVVFITKMAKLVKLVVYVGGERVFTIDGDGLIVSTTLGSTAYSLSAGGPIVDPNLDVVILTPMNPVQLHLRPIVVSPNARIEVEVRPASGPLYVSIDGQHLEDLQPGALAVIERCGAPARIARFRWWENYYERLYSRLLAYW
jgi:NAD+ kinase